MPSVFLGVDGGQTSTTALIGDETGRVLGMGRGGPCNHAAASEGRQRFLSAMTECMSRACGHAGLDAGQVVFESAALGFSGGPADKEPLLAGVVRAARMVVSSDIDIALAGALAGEPGIVTIGGTGSVAFGRNADGRTARAGGWGSLFGDEGSAFDLVREALRAALRHEEGWGPETSLHHRLLDVTGIGHVHDLVRKFYSADFSIPRIAAFATLVDEAAQQGDPVAREILDTAAAQLARLVLVVRGRLFRPGEQVRTSYVGGVFRSRSLLHRYRGLLEAEGCPAIPAIHGPACGALLQAYRAAGLHVALSAVPESEK